MKIEDKTTNIISYTIYLYIEFTDDTFTVIALSFEDASLDTLMDLDFDNFLHRNADAVAQNFKKTWQKYRQLESRRYKKLATQFKDGEWHHIAEKAKPTNFERITQSPETLAKFLCSEDSREIVDKSVFDTYKQARKECEEWLLQESKWWRK